MSNIQINPNHPPFDPDEQLCAEFSALGRLRRRIGALLISLTDSGLLGMTPLETHIHVCGYSRSGTTLLQMMLEFAYPKSRHFGHEISGRRAIMNSRRNHRVMITKKPKDIFRLHQLINYYRDRKTTFKPIVMVRDPRDVLTSSHITTKKERPYHVKLDRWKQEQPFIRYYMEAPDVLLIRYEDLTGDTTRTQRTIEEFVQEKAERTFGDFHKKTRDDFDSRHLNGVRPVDQETIARWKRPEHADRIRQILEEIPELPQELIAMGYETDESWTEAYLPSPAEK